MKLRQLACFVALVEEGSFTRAAAALGIAQPSLSQQVRTLELELGGPLVERLPRGIAVTPAGRALLPEARSALRAAERGSHGVRAALQLEGGELEIATVLSLAVGFLPGTIRVWHEHYPTVAIRLHEFRHRRLLEEAVQEGIADFGIGPMPLREWDGQLEQVGWEEFVIVLPRSDPLAGRRKVRIEELADREWVLFHPDHGLAGIVEEVCLRAGFSPRGTVRTSQAEGAARLAAAGLGPTLVPDNIVLPGLDGAVVRLDPPVTRDVVAYTRTEWSPTARAFVGLLQVGPPVARPRGAVVMRL
jgi:DNA-binding transcriptional LysR family regulator